jgi:cytochrome d ubiquinol oxidase subunit II
MQLATVWFLLIGFLFVGYAILDGFDLGVGAVHLIVARDDTERRQVLNAIGPVWDGNEVWLITGGGALFAAFPTVYGTVFSGFYLAMMLLLGALILRATSIEFRSKETAVWWRRSWDVGFSVSSALAVILFGVALGNLLRGLPIDADGAYRGGLIGLLNPFAIAVGVLSLSLAVLQGSAWLAIKTEGAVQARARKTGAAAVVLVVATWIATTALAWADARRVFDNFGSLLAWVGPFLTANILIYLVVAMRSHRDGRAFFFSSLSVIGFALTAGIALYPNLVPAVDKVRSLTVDNAHSSDTTLVVMLVIALIGMPIVLAYTGFVYWKFKGKVRVDEASY